MVGSVVRHYEILNEVGRGSMGIVYRALDRRLNRHVILKFLPGHLSVDHGVRERFVREAQAGAATEHINICTVYEISETEDGQTFIAMAYYDGQTLKDRIEEGPLEIDECVKVVQQIADGLAAAHRHGIVHRDIKPSNIILTRDGTVKIVDFGIAKLAGASALTKSNSFLGTISYMSPEQIRREEVDHRTDIWSLGVVAFEAITGRRPFWGDYEQVIAYGILNDRVPPLRRERPEIPGRLVDIIERMLDRNRKSRFQHAEDVVRELAAVLNDQSSPTTRRWRTLRNRASEVLSSPRTSVSVLGLLLVVSTLYSREIFVGSSSSLMPGARSHSLTSALSTPTAISAGSGLAFSPTWSPTGDSIAYASNDAGNMDIWIRALSDGAARRLTSTRSNESSPSWSPDGRYVAYVSDAAGGGVYIHDLVTDQVFQRTRTGTDPAWSNSGNRLVYSILGDVRIIDNVFGESPSRPIERGTTGRPQAIWGPNDRYVIFWNRKDADVVAKHVQTGERKLLGIVPNGSEVTGLSFPSGDNHLFLSMGSFGGKQDLWRIEMDLHTMRVQGEAVRISGTTTDDVDVAVAHGGANVAFAGLNIQRQLFKFDRDNRNGRIDIESGRRLTSAGRLNYYPAVSRDGRYVVYTSQYRSNGLLYYINLKDPSQREARVTVAEGSGIREVHASFSIDDSSLLFSSTVGGSYEIWQLTGMQAEGRRLSNNDNRSRDISPVVAPGGGRIVFYSNRLDDWDLWEIEVDTSEQAIQKVLLEWQSSHELYPSWTPDGSALAFSSDREDSQDIWTIDLDSPSGSRLTDYPGNEVWPMYSPDGRFLYYVSDHSGHNNLWAIELDSSTDLQITDYAENDRGLPLEPLFTKPAITDDAIILPIEQRHGNIYVTDLTR